MPNSISSHHSSSPKGSAAESNSQDHSSQVSSTGAAASPAASSPTAKTASPDGLKEKQVAPHTASATSSKDSYTEDFISKTNADRSPGNRHFQLSSSHLRSGSSSLVFRQGATPHNFGPAKDSASERVDQIVIARAGATKDFLDDIGRASTSRGPQPIDSRGDSNNKANTDAPLKKRQRTSKMPATMELRRTQIEHRLTSSARSSLTPSPSSTSASSSNKSSSEEPEAPPGSAKALRHSNQPNEMKSFLAARHVVTRPSAQLDVEKLKMSSPNVFSAESIKRFVKSPANQCFSQHSIETGEDYAPSNKNSPPVFSSVGWHDETHLKREAQKHPELYHPSVLEKIEALGTSKPTNYIRAYVYKNDHITGNPNQSRRAGDVLMIDEHQGLLAAFSKNGRIKTGRVDEPEVLRTYIQDEKFKDLGRM